MSASKAAARKMNGNRLPGSWSQFWFQPTDPTTLGLMRIMTGLIVLYVHLVYCFDMQAFFGRHAWVDLETITKDRKESPTYAGPWDYERGTVLDPIRTTLPDRNDVNRRRAVISFLKDLPDNLKEREYKLRFLRRAQEWIKPSQAYDAVRNWLEYTAQLDADDRAAMARILSKELTATNELQVDLPQPMLEMPTKVRSIVWEETLDFLSLLPKGLTPVNEGREVVRWLNEIGYGGRVAALKLMARLPENAEERSRFIDYFDYWNLYPDELYAKGRDIFSLWFHVTNPTTMAVCHGLILFIFVLFTLGLYTRITSVLTWLAALFYIHRNQYILFGMDTMMMILLFYLMIGPSGAALSIDRLRARYRASRALAKAHGKPVPWAEAILAGPLRSRSANFVLRLFQIHFCIMYMSSGLSKLKGTTWWDTTANWFTIANPEFSPIWYDLYDRALRALVNVRPLFMILLAGMNYFTLAMEIGFPFLIWTRMRPYMVIAAVLLHTGIAMTMGLSIFGLLMMTLLLCYIPAAVIRERLQWPTGSGPALQVRYHSRNPAHQRTVSVLRMFDLADQLRLHDEAGPHGEGATSEPVRLTVGDGPAVSGAALVTTATESLVFLNSVKWMFWIPGASWLLRRQMKV